MCLLFFFSAIQLTAGLCCRGVWGSPVSSVVVRPSVRPSVSGKTRVLCQEPSRVGRRRQKNQPSHHGGEEKQQTHGWLLGTKLKD